MDGVNQVEEGGPEPLIEISGHLLVEVPFHQQSNCSETHPGRLVKTGSRVELQELVNILANFSISFFEDKGENVKFVQYLRICLTPSPDSYCICSPNFNLKCKR